MKNETNAARKRFEAHQRAVAACKAKDLLVHYLRTVWEKAGLNWDTDNDAEIEYFVDCLITCCKGETN